MIYIVWIVAVLVVGAYICGPIVDPDLWWHIVVGRWILANGTVPHQDYWNYFGLGMPWRAYSWSNEIVYALLEKHFGMHGLFSLKLILAIGLAASLCYVLGKISRDWTFGCLLGSFATIACYNHFTLRPQSLIWILFVWLLYALCNTGKKNIIPAVFVIFLVWANSHLSAVLGLVTIALWLFEGKLSKQVLVVLAVAFLGTLFTPYYGSEWVTFLSKTSHPFDHKTIAEFQPATIMQYSTGLLVSLIALLVFLVFKQPNKIKPFKLLLCAIFCFAGLAIIKFMPFAVFVCAFYIAELWRDAKDSEDQLIVGIRKLCELINNIPREGLAFLLFCLAFVLVARVWQSPLSYSIIPVDAVKFMLDKRLPHPILNDFGRGGYMMYALSDDKGNVSYPVPIDGRTNITPFEIWQKSSDALFGRRNWREFIDKFQAVTILWPNESPLVSILDATNNWCRVFQSGDDTKGYSVYIRKDVYKTAYSALESINCG